MYMYIYLYVHINICIHSHQKLGSKDECEDIAQPPHGLVCDWHGEVRINAHHILCRASDRYSKHSK